MSLGRRRHFGYMFGWSKNLWGEISTSRRHPLLFISMVELLAKAGLEEGTWTECGRWGARWCLPFYHNGMMGKANGLRASSLLSASASTKHNKPHSDG